MALGTAHHHHHHHPADWPDGERSTAPITRLLTGAAVAALLLALAGLAVWWPSGEGQVDRDALGFGERVDATVTGVSDEPCSYDPSATCRAVTVDVERPGGAIAPATLETEATVGTPLTRLDAGDEVVLHDAGPEVPPESRYSFADVRRSRPLILLAGLFAVFVVVLGRLRGLLALAGIGVTFAVLLWFLFPALLRGAPPVGVALTATTLIAFGTLYLAHGVTHATTVALLGTLASLALTAALAVGFSGAASLSGLADEDSLALLTAAPDLDFRGLLLAAVIVGALGVLDDVTVTQVSAVAELRRSDPSMPRRKLFQSAIRIGRDHIASTVNTLVLAYSAAALPLLLIYSQSGLGMGDVLTSETVAVELVQTLVGSIGLVASVPLTTALAAWALTYAQGHDDGDHGHGYGDHGDDERGEEPRDEPGRVPPRRPAPQPRPPAEPPAAWFPPSLSGGAPPANEDWAWPPPAPRGPNRPPGR